MQVDRQEFYKPERLQKIVNYLEFMQVSTDQPEMVETKRVTKKMASDVTACIFWLKNRKAVVWREKTETEGTLIFKKMPTIIDDDGKKLEFKIGDPS